MRLITLLIFISLGTHAQSIRSIVDQNGPFRKDTIIHITEESYLPVSILKGKKPGPVFTILAGIHGFEYPPIIAVQTLYERISIDSLSGTLIIIPIANTAAFYQRSPFINPIDKKNLNNVFPGAENGSPTEKLADIIAQQIIPVSNIFLDIHGGDANEDLLPFICYYDKKDSCTLLAKDLCNQSAMQNIVSYPYNITPTEPAKYAFKYATQQGITALSIEAGKLGAVHQRSINFINNALDNMLSYLNMYSPCYHPSSSARNYFSNQAYVHVPEQGIFYSHYQSGDKITKGQNIGYITNEFGVKKTDIFSPETGTILYKIGTPPVSKGETLCCIGY